MADPWWRGKKVSPLACTAQFPFFGHRTSAEVDETERLLAAYNDGEPLGVLRLRRLTTLLARQRVNCPSEEIPPEQAA